MFERVTEFRHGNKNRSHNVHIDIMIVKKKLIVNNENQIVTLKCCKRKFVFIQLLFSKLQVSVCK